VLALVLFVAACGSGSSTSTAGPTSTVATTPTPSTTTTTTPSTTATTQPPAPVPRVEPVTAADLPASWRPGCPIGPEALRRITVAFLGFDGADHVGALIVHADWADALVDAFGQLHAAGFPIERMEPVDAFGGSDDASMAVNNTKAFNCRPVTGGTGWSRHAYGLAIDINPRQNPYVTAGGTVLPPEGAPYAQERGPRQGVITADGPVVAVFAAIGWQWGGHWSDPVDYQHVDAGR
jgi:hypothetical protein